MPTLDWLNRATAFTTAAQVPYRLLEPVSAHGDGNSPNLLIQGDNLEALKALLPFYRGQVKCIFIDPPYNTQSAFEHYDDNLEHAQWLSMMLPRLQLLRELLREDGSIWVTIDDNEGHYLKVLMDEVFGRRNFLCGIAWEKRYSPPPDTKEFGYVHDQLLVYRKGAAFTRKLLPATADQTARYKNPDSDSRGPWKAMDYTCRYSADERPNLYYAIRQPNTNEDIWPKRSRVWAMSHEVYQQHAAENRIWWGANGKNSVPALKNFLSEVAQGMMPMSIWKHDLAGHNQDGKKEALALLGNTPFSTPKPEKLIAVLLNIATNPNDLVLDSFLGSGTTAAVAHKMGRRWIGIEMGEHAATHCLPRLQKVVEGEQGGVSQAVGWQGGGGFRFMQLGAPVFDAQGRIHPEVRFATLAAFVWQQQAGTAYDAAQGQPGTPYLGTYFKNNSVVARIDLGSGPVSSENPPPALVEPPEPPETSLPAPGPATACYLLFNGILGDRRPASGNVLTRDVLAALLALHAQAAPSDAALVVYGESVRVGPERLAQAGVTFKQIPYDVRAK